LAVTYCTTDDVPLFAQLRGSNGRKVVWGTNPPVPTDADIQTLIESSEGIIEDITKQAWGTRYITITDEIQDIHGAYGRFRSSYAYIFLNNQKIAAFNSVAGDKIEIFEDNAWVDYLTSYNEGRGDDFFVDYQVGKIYFRNRNPPIGQQLARITYRQNSGSIVPEAVRQATALQVAIFLASNPGIQILFPSGEGGGANSVADIENYRTQIDLKLTPHILVKQPMNTKFIPIY
jgi:hypothetical protein